MYLVGLFLLIWGGIAFWWKRHRGAAVFLLALSVGPILFLGLFRAG